MASITCPDYRFYGHMNWICKHRPTFRYLSAVAERIGIWHSLGGLVSFPQAWLAQCLCESNESLPYRKLVEAAKAEE